MLKSNRCPSCGLPKYKWTRSTKFRCCKKQCTEYFYENLVVATSWSELRIQVFDRDCRRCQKCWKQFTYSGLIADHIKPIALDGLQWDKDNIQTLCITCNKVKTKNDIGDIAKMRRMNKHKRISKYNKFDLLKEAIEAGDLI